MEKLTARYVDEHAANVQTYESFMRSLVYGALQQAKANIPADGSDQYIFDAKIEIKPTAILCIEVCIETPFGKYCKHVGI